MIQNENKNKNNIGILNVKDINGKQPGGGSENGERTKYR